MTKLVTIEAAIQLAADSLQVISDSAKLDAELLLLHILNKPKSYLFTWPDRTLDDAQYSAFFELVAERAKGRPVAHIIGHRDFWTLDLEVNNSTLIPRPDTETLVEVVLESINNLNITDQSKGLDLGTGTGAIALALASELPSMSWLGADFNHDAVNLARRNAQRNKVENCQFIQSDWFSNVGAEKYAVIVSNPPYIDPTDPHLSEGDVQFEPKSALVAGASGTADLEHIIANAPKYLTSPGLLAVEHGYDQGAIVRQIFNKNLFKNIKTFVDLGQNDRITIGYF